MIKIGIVDDHAVVRSGLKAFFSTVADFRVAGEAASGREALDLVRTVELDVLVMDLAMPGQSGIDALRVIRAKAPEVGILILSGFPEEQYAVNLFRQGASGYLNKGCSPEEILEGVRVVASGKRYITSSMGNILAAQLIPKESEKLHETLTEREFQIFLRIARGEANYQIADSLSLSRKTVTTHRTKVLRKLQLSTNSEVTYYAIKAKLLD